MSTNTGTEYPIVVLKMAQTLDGKIATAKGESKWITSDAARTYVQKLRASCDAVLVGKNTILQDDARLDVRGSKISPKKMNYWRVFLDAKAEVKASARVFQGAIPTVRVVNKSVCRSAAFKKRRCPKGEILLPVASDKKGRLDLKEVLRGLKGLGIQKVLVEGGGETAWSFIQAGLVNKVIWFIAPKILGGRDALTSVQGEGFIKLDQCLAIKNLKTRRLGPDILIEGDI